MSLGTKKVKRSLHKTFFTLFFLEILTTLINLSQLIFIALSYIHATNLVASSPERMRSYSCAISE